MPRFHKGQIVLVTGLEDTKYQGTLAMVTNPSKAGFVEVDFLSFGEYGLLYYEKRFSEIPDTMCVEDFL